MKVRLCITLVLCMLLSCLPLTVWAGDPPALQLTQAQDCEPGQPLTLLLCLPDMEIAGGFVSIGYDDSLFSLASARLLQATEDLTLTYADAGGKINLLLDGTQNVTLSGAFLELTFDTIEEIRPDTYTFTCTVPDPASFYSVAKDGSTSPLYVSGCTCDVRIIQPTLPPCPARYLACQERRLRDGSMQVRILALVEQNTSLSRGSYGFTCSVTDADGTRELTLGGSELTDAIDGGGHTYTKEELGGQIFTAVLKISSAGEATLTLTPFVKQNGQTLYGGTYTLYYKDGSYQKTVG